MLCVESISLAFNFILFFGLVCSLCLCDRPKLLARSTALALSLVQRRNVLHPASCYKSCMVPLPRHILPHVCRKMWMTSLLLSLNLFITAFRIGQPCTEWLESMQEKEGAASKEVLLALMSNRVSISRDVFCHGFGFGTVNGWNSFWCSVRMHGYPAFYILRTRWALS